MVILNRILITLGALLLLLTVGCREVEVKSVHVPNRPGPPAVSGPAELSGVPQATLSHFRDKYPPSSWTLAGATGARVGIGPVLLSREFVAALGVGVQVGGLTVVSGGATYWIISRYNRETQAVLVEAFTTAKEFRVMILSSEAGAELYQGGESYRSLSRRGIRYYVQTTLVLGEEGASVIYTRFIRVATGEVIAATSAEGNGVQAATRAAAADLIKRIGKDK